MASHNELERVFAGVLETVMPQITEYMTQRMRVVFMAGVETGQEQSRDIIAAATKVLTGGQVQVALGVASRAPATPPKQSKARANGAYRGVATAVRTALKAIASNGKSADASAMMEYIHETLGRRDITVQQIRSSLKQLLDGGEAERLSRGEYRAGPNFQMSKVNGSTSLFSAAA